MNPLAVNQNVIVVSSVLYIFGAVFLALASYKLVKNQEQLFKNFSLLIFAIILLFMAQFPQHIPFLGAN